MLVLWKYQYNRQTAYRFNYDKKIKSKSWNKKEKCIIKDKKET